MPTILDLSSSMFSIALIEYITAAVFKWFMIDNIIVDVSIEIQRPEEDFAVDSKMVSLLMSRKAERLWRRFWCSK